MFLYLGGLLIILVAGWWFFVRDNEEVPSGVVASGGGMSAVVAAGSGGSGSAGASAAPQDDDMSKPPVFLYFGSQSGAAEGFCRTLQTEARQAGFRPKIVDLEDFEPAEFKKHATAGDVVVFCMATYGEGDPTDNAIGFVDWLNAKGEHADASEESRDISGLRFTVFGLGNRQYEHYNKMGKVTNAKLEELGAERVYKYGEGDDDGTLDDDFDEWKDDLWTELRRVVGATGPEEQQDSQGLAPLPEFAWRVDRIRTSDVEEALRTRRTSVDPASVAMSSRYYFASVPAKVLVNRELRPDATDGSTRHLEIELKGTGLTYDTADNLGIMPANNPTAVDSLCRWMNYDPDMYFRLEREDNEAGADAKKLFPTPCTVREALSYFCDIQAHPRRDFLNLLAHHATDARERERLALLSSKEGKDEYKAWIHEPRRSIAEVLEAFPSAAGNLPLGRFLETVPRLQPRLYTICSSSKVHPNRVHVVVSVVKEKQPGPENREFFGVCSNFMARTLPPSTEGGRRTDGGESKSDRARPQWPTMRVHVRGSTFKMPEDPSLPIIMVGPGTGVAPMRAFLQERKHQIDSGATVGETMLFFGCRRREEDFIYQDELLKYAQDEVITHLHLAFSRETQTKVYVQHKLKEEARTVYDLLSRGGSFYVCGGTHMGHDVLSTLEEIGQEFTGDGKAFVQELHDTSRYVAELWS